MKKSIILLFGIVYLTTAFFYGCSSEKYISKWTNNKIVIDGRDNDWANKTKYYKDENILVGVQNDNKNLYVLFETPDRMEKMQIMHRGFIVWLDNDGGNSEDFGIKFPIGMKGNFYPGKDMKEVERNFVPTEMEIYNKHDKNWSRLSIGQAKGISVAIANNDDKLIYEMSIDLHPEKGDVYFLNPKADKIGIGFQTVKLERKGLSQRPTQGESEGGDEGGYGGYGREGGEFGEGGGAEGRRGGQGFRPPEQLNFWLTTTLATNQ